MKKFSDVSNKKIEKIKSKKEVISGLVEESLSIKDGVIVGKELLVETINKIIEMNDSKTTINVLESVRLMSYRGSLDFNLINESIENETKKLNSIKHEPIVETVEVVEEVVVNESVLTPDMIAGLIGITSIVGLGQLLIALDAGKLGEVGKKFAKQLRELNDVASSVKTGTLDAETYDKIYKESVSNEEDLDLKPLISEIQELNSDEYKEVLDSIKEGEFGEGTKKLIDVLSNLNEITRKKLSENK